MYNLPLTKFLYRPVSICNIWLAHLNLDNACLCDFKKWNSNTFLVQILYWMLNELLIYLYFQGRQTTYSENVLVALF